MLSGGVSGSVADRDLKRSALKTMLPTPSSAFGEIAVRAPAVATSKEQSGWCMARPRGRSAGFDPMHEAEAEAEAEGEPLTLATLHLSRVRLEEVSARAGLFRLKRKYLR
jgi:hypothetical protein